jgi:hypothetical protein
MHSTLITLTSIALFSSLIAAAPAKHSSSSSTASATKILVQLNGVHPFGEDAIQRSIPTDGSVFSINVVTDIISAQIVDGAGLRQPSCLVFSDLEGTVGATEVSVTEDETELLLGVSEAQAPEDRTVKVGSLRCSSL